MRPIIGEDSQTPALANNGTLSVVLVDTYYSTNQTQIIVLTGKRSHEHYSHCVESVINSPHSALL